MKKVIALSLSLMTTSLNAVFIENPEPTGNLENMVPVKDLKGKHVANMEHKVFSDGNGIAYFFFNLNERDYRSSVVISKDDKGLGYALSTKSLGKGADPLVVVAWWQAVMAAYGEAIDIKKSINNNFNLSDKEVKNLLQKLKSYKVSVEVALLPGFEKPKQTSIERDPKVTYIEYSEGKVYTLEEIASEPNLKCWLLKAYQEKDQTALSPLGQCKICLGLQYGGWLYTGRYSVDMVVVEGEPHSTLMAAEEYINKTLGFKKGSAEEKALKDYLDDIFNREAYHIKSKKSEGAALENDLLKLHEQLSYIAR